MNFFFPHNTIVIPSTIFLILFSFISQTYSLITNNNLYSFDQISTDSENTFGSLSRSLVGEDANNDEKGNDDEQKKSDGNDDEQKK
ncbi:MAG TPA: hypothetical protein VFK40_12185 [Nitrososphaeraceae archaeon]|nr:hypothetical protein [Nitrososphaeraceae archaeon]